MQKAEEEIKRFILLFKWPQSQHEFACRQFYLSFLSSAVLSAAMNGEMKGRHKNRVRASVLEPERDTRNLWAPAPGTSY